MQSTLLAIRLTCNLPYMQSALRAIRLMCNPPYVQSTLRAIRLTCNQPYIQSALRAICLLCNPPFVQSALQAIRLTCNPPYMQSALRAINLMCNLPYVQSDFLCNPGPTWKKIPIIEIVNAASVDLERISSSNLVTFYSLCQMKCSVWQRTLTFTNIFKLKFIYFSSDVAMHRKLPPPYTFHSKHIFVVKQ